MTSTVYKHGNEVATNSDGELRQGVVIEGGTLNTANEIASTTAGTLTFAIAEGTPNGQDLYTKLGAVGGDTIRVTSTCDCWFAWGNSDANAETAAAETGLDDTDTSGITIHPAGVELYTVPAGYSATTKASMAFDTDTTNGHLANGAATGFAYVTLVA